MRKKIKVEYSDEVADICIKRHGLRAEVKKVWKSRGHIPGAYLDEDFKEADKVSDRDPVVQKILEILNFEEIAVTKFRALGLKGTDISRGKSTLSEEEKIALLAEVSEIRSKISKAMSVPTDSNLLLALTDARIHASKIIDKKKYLRLSQKKSLITQFEKNEIKAGLNRLYSKLKI